MKPYDLPRNLNLESPDLSDIRHYGLKSSKSRAKGRTSGRYENVF